MESLGYILVSLMGKRLPWQGIRKATKVQRNEAIADIKESISPNDICKNLPRDVGQRTRDAFYRIEISVTIKKCIFKLP